MTLARVVRILVVLVLPPLLLLIVDGSRAQAYPREIKPGCRYEGRRYQEGTAVSTSEPCLRCRCTEGALRCRLRICPRLPNAPPPGCGIRPPAENACCAELVCGDVENMLRRAGVQTNRVAEDEKPVHHSRTEGCLHDGLRYGPGSAMMGSRRCEYCYCISGARRCIRPKCLLPLPGCTPLYAPHSCCPVAYNCTHHHPSTAAPTSGNGCRVGERAYVEGEMVRDIEWKAACDNCFCAMGAIRCVPLACAPPLQGCSPIVREGQCCPSTYNCILSIRFPKEGNQINVANETVRDFNVQGGSIEVKATQNYASYAFISKDYAKFRKETNYFPATDRSTNPSVEGRGHRVVEKQVSISTIDPEEDSSIATSTAWPSTMETDMMDNEILIGTMDHKSSLEPTTAAASTTNELSSNTESTAAFESTLASTARDADSVADSCTTCTSTGTLAESTIVTTGVLPGDPPGAGDGTTISSPEWTTVLSELTPDNGNDENEDAGGENKNKNATENEDRNENEAAGAAQGTGQAGIIEKNKATTHPFAISTDAGDAALLAGEKSPESSALVEGTEAKRPVIGPSSTILMPGDILVMNVTVKTNVSVGHIQGVTINPIRSISPDVEAILNITHREKEDYDYDYSQPTLPPSLSNVRIIPFVAADALVKDKDVSSTETGYPAELRPTDASGFYDIARTQENRFSPPMKTEGGFVPKEPSSYFDPPYRPTDLNLEIGTGVTVVPEQIANPHRKNDDLSRGKCHFENTEYAHGEILPRATLCIICMCHHGEVVCFSEKCPPLKIGCRRIRISDEKCCGKIVCVEAGESPTVVLDRADATAPSQRQPMVSPDPFRDVIKTEPAPDLPSLIEDMIPYLAERGIATSAKPTTASVATSASKISAQGSVAGNRHPPSLDFVEQMLLHMRPPFDYAGGETAGVDSSFVSNTRYGMNGEVLATDTVSLTYDSKDQLPGKIPERPESSSSGDASSFVELNRTIDDSANDFPIVGNSTNVQPAMGKLKSESDDPEVADITDDDDGGDVVVVATRHEDHRTESSNSSNENVNGEYDDAIFSLDSVLQLLFSPNGSSDRAKPTETATPDVSSTVNGAREEILAASSTSTERLTDETDTIETSLKVLDNDIPMGTLLKLAGCNIYGRMYRVGRIIAELSSLCEECRCTEIGVQCKQLEC